MVLLHVNLLKKRVSFTFEKGYLPNCAYDCTWQNFVEYGMVNRDRHDIVFEILKKAVSGKRKTEIMREVGLSYTQSKQYFNMLLQKGLLEIDDDKFKTTEKGLEFMNKCAQCLLSHWNKQKKR